MCEREHLQPTSCVREPSSTRSASSAEGKGRERRIGSRCSPRGRGSPSEREREERQRAIVNSPVPCSPRSSSEGREVAESEVSLTRRACVRASTGFPRGRGSPGSRWRYERSADAGVYVDRARRSTSVGARPNCERVSVCVRRRAHTTLIAASAGASHTRVYIEFVYLLLPPGQ